MILKIVKLALIVSSIFYPFVLIFFNQYWDDLLVVMIILFCIRGYMSDLNQKKFSFLAASFFLILLIFDGYDLKFIYPVLVSVLFLVIFGVSLKDESIITKIARKKEPELSCEAVLYTRNLTKIWCIFFLLNAIVAFGLSLLENKYFWALYSGFISYLIMGFLFFGEIVFRKFILLGKLNGK